MNFDLQKYDYLHCTLLIDWFRDNYMTLNPSKCHLLEPGYKDESMSEGGQLLLGINVC